MRITASSKGVALFIVLGLIAIFVPVLAFLYQMGSSQVQQAVKFHEAIKAEAAGLSGTSAALSRLQGYQTGLQKYYNQPLGNDLTYDLTIKPTGRNVFVQNLYFIFAKCIIERHNFTIMANCEQFLPDPNPPVSVIPTHFWNTVEPYNITLLADIKSMTNNRGEDLLYYEEAVAFEKSQSKGQYQGEMMKKIQELPDELQKDWPNIVAKLTEDKIEP